MSEFRRPRPEDTFIWPSATWATALRAMLADLTYAKAWELFHETDSGSRVLGGFRATETPALTTRIERGIALVYDAAASSPAPKWKVVFNPGNISAVHDAHTGQHRIDVVSVSYAMVEDNEQTLGRRPSGSAPAATDTQIGCVCTAVVTKGTATADPNPTVPATPAGNLKLWEVYVPVTSGALVYLDTRLFAPGPRNRPQDMTPRIHSTVGSGDELPLAEFKQRASGAGAMSAEYLVDFASSLGWDLGADLPYLRRNKGGSGELSGKMYLLASPARTWRRSYPLGASPGAVNYATGDAGDVLVSFTGPSIEIERLSTDACVGGVSIPLPMDVRALLVSDLRVTVRMDATFTGTVTHLRVQLVKIDDTGGSTTIGEKELNGMTPGSWRVVSPIATAPDDFDSWTDEVLAPGEALYINVDWEITASGGAGTIRLNMCELGLTEAKA